MKRKELHALFNEVSSRCSPVRGIYDAPSTERERMIQRELKKYRTNLLVAREKQALEDLLGPMLPTLHTVEEVKHLFTILGKYYSPEQIPDQVYTVLMSKPFEIVPAEQIRKNTEHRKEEA